MTPAEKYAQYSGIKRPPVVEAVIDITTAPITIERLNEIKLAGVDGVFPIKENIQNFEVEFRTDGTGSSSLSGSFIGYMHRSSNGREVVQSRVNGFAYNILQPYTNWQSFFERAMEFWRAYREVRGEVPVLKLGLRYINAISVPLDFLPAHEAFDVCLNLPNRHEFGAVQQLNYGYTTVDKETGTTSTVNFGQQAPLNGITNFLLDIDATVTISKGDLSDKDIGEHLVRLRELKNTIFFGTLSSKLLDLYR